jgi:hypothetical protein
MRFDVVEALAFQGLTGAFRVPHGFARRVLSSKPWEWVEQSLRASGFEGARLQPCRREETEYWA